MKSRSVQDGIMPARGTKAFTLHPLFTGARQRYIGGRTLPSSRPATTRTAPIAASSIAGDIGAGIIARSTGRPNAQEEWVCRAGFYPGSGPSEIKTGTAAEVTPVSEIADWKFSPGRISEQLMADYTAEVQPKGKKAAA